MPVRITAKFTKSDIAKMINRKRQAINDAILLNLKRTGERFIVNARNNGAYKDRTGNLRSSIGYVILFNGLQYVKGGFIKVTSSGEGVNVGNDFIEKLAAQYQTGWVLIGVAGMDYAAAVEALGFDVITASSIQAEIDLKNAFERLRNKIK